MKVYLLTAGDGADYRVIGVYDEAHVREAKAAALAVGGRAEAVYDLNGYAPPATAGDYHQVTLYRDGGLCSYEAQPKLNLDGTARICDYRVHAPDNRTWRLLWRGYAKNKREAIKAAEAIRAKVADERLPQAGKH